eukprot:jgi/Chrzof1/3787/Cz13g08220.t1
MKVLHRSEHSQGATQTVRLHPVKFKLVSFDMLMGLPMYRYGPEAAEAASQSIPVAQDMLQATLNLNRLSARAVVSRTAKKAAKMYLKDTLAGFHPDDQAAGHRVPPHLAGSSSYATAATGTGMLPAAAPGKLAIGAPAVM